MFLYFFMFIATAGFAQNKKWILGSPMTNAFGTLNTSTTGSLRFYEADFTGAVPVFPPRILGASVNAISSAGLNETLNSTTDSTGNILFYVFANCTSAFSGSTTDNMYFVAYDPATAKDEVFATVLPTGTGTGASSSKDLNIVKKEGAANQYYVIYKTACINTYSPDEIRYLVVDMNTRTVSSPVTLLSSSLNEGMAVSVKNCVLNNRWLFSTRYASGSYEVYRSSITSTGISTPVLIYTIAIPGNFSLGQGDIEISPASDKIAFVNYTSGSVNKDIILFDFNLATGAISGEHWIDNPGNYIIEVEFSPDGQRLFAFRGGTSAITPSLYNIAVPPAGVNYTITPADQLSLTLTASHTLEVAYDGRLYFASQIYNTTLNYISNPNAPTASTIIGTTAPSSFGAGNAVSFAMPEQIDGDDQQNITPNLTVTGPGLLCAGQSVTLTAAGATSYTWSGGSTDTSASTTVSPATTTAYYVTGTNGCAAVTDTITVQVDLPFNITVTASDDSLCSGQSVTLNASGSPTYQWSGGSTATAASVNVSPLSTITYYVSGAANACAADTDTLTIYVETTPAISVTGTTAICAGQSATLTATGSSNYTWSGGSAATTAAITVSPAATTTYYVTGTSLHCGSDTDTVTVNVDTIPVISISGTDTICTGQSATLTASGGSTYAWSTTQITPAITVTPAATTTYTVNGSNGSCMATVATFDLVVNPVPSAIITGPAYLCTDVSGSYTAVVSSGAIPYQYAWSTGSSTSIISITPVTTLTPLNVAVTDANGCSSTSSYTITTVPDPLAIVTESGSGCAPLNVNFASEATTAISFEWQFGDGFTSTEQNPSHAFSNSGSYSVTLITTNMAGCSDTLVLDSAITAYPSPVADISSTGDVSTDHPLLTVYNNAQNADNCILYFGDGTSLAGCNWSDVSHAYEQEGNYAVTQIVTTANGCTDTAVIYINASYESTLFAPNAITGNSNGLNDVFYIYGTGLLDFHLTIYDRWGERIFESHDQYQGWDGTYKGKPVEESVYVWKVDYSTKRTGQESRIGHVTVLR
ncbi:MAG: hypothetical protein JWP12_1191 [Bacteroidetes bacterium]|nr:hypothetical protein [Bacteroidota bacterium]